MEENYSIQPIVSIARERYAASDLDNTYLDTTDYYALLGVAVDAPASDIKAAFKKLALQYHPDVYKGEDAHERMRVLLLAYQTLNDPNTRRDYDQQRMHSLGQGSASDSFRTSSFSGSSGSSSSAYTPHTSAAFNRSRSSDVSPSARRDRQRHYDFPIVQERHSTHIDLIDFSYDLPPEKAHTLQHAGLLRGVASKLNGSYFCHRCHNSWPVESNGLRATTLPLFCPKCQASDWSEYLLLHCSSCNAVYESEQIRYEVGMHSYGKAKTGLCPPYELFPLCPYCGTARWCPAENERVDELRHRKAERDARMRMVWIGVTLFAIIVLGVIALNMMR